MKIKPVLYYFVKGEFFYIIYHIEGNFGGDKLW